MHGGVARVSSWHPKVLPCVHLPCKMPPHTQVVILLYIVCVRVCVCHPLYQRVPCHCFSLQPLNEAGGHSSFHQSVANEATDDWRGYEPVTPGSRTCFPFQLLTSCPLSLFCFMVFHDTPPQTGFLQQPSAALHRFAAAS